MTYNLEPTIGLEPMASSLPRRYSTTELRGRYDPDCKRQNYWSGKRDSNPQPSAWKADALPLSYSRLIPATQYTVHWPGAGNGGGGRIRTSEGSADRFTVCSLWPLGNPSTKNYPLIEQNVAQCTETSQLYKFIRAWSWRWDLNPQPTDYKSVALPVELRQQRTCAYTCPFFK